MLCISSVSDISQMRQKYWEGVASKSCPRSLFGLRFPPRPSTSIMCLPPCPSSSSVFVLHSHCVFCVCTLLFVFLYISYPFEKHNESKNARIHICTILQVSISSRDDLSSDMCGPPCFDEISIKSWLPFSHYEQLVLNSNCIVSGNIFHLVRCSVHKAPVSQGPSSSSFPVPSISFPPCTLHQLYFVFCTSYLEFVFLTTSNLFFWSVKSSYCHFVQQLVHATSSHFLTFSVKHH